MADTWVHNALARWLLGKKGEKVNALMDAPAAVLGPRHRAVMHDEKAIAAFLALEGPESALAAALHLWADENEDAATRAAMILDPKGQKKALRTALKKKLGKKNPLVDFLMRGLR